MQKSLVIIGTVIFASAVMLGAGLYFGSIESVPVDSFEECLEAGYPVMESYPRQCRAGDKNFSEDIGNELEKASILRVTRPRPNEVVSNPLEIRGEARGLWFFEAEFPVVFLDDRGTQIGFAIARAQGEWMSEDFVPFSSVMEFESSESVSGILLFKKSNPSGLPEYDDELRMPVKFVK
ncbi:MAG: hypothetical protein A3C07_00395 [Candidatus Sungbacteria bacterium RIFCSPHIGHO2_02_FULL_47_11]|uniref:Bacterial spore germination immunoglobulin-like domain-containing protein n=1 Tax=Candidatus Sungbacteria bacterium RIFCSPHIGHO2_02_FULL_47_11 TaxID=1802270 RepID=A0A1G2KK89_9BACT|nr:MAG: hypothetical protein A3C07_00395 [Candidatus Sungbacteria bacterium RIFCSPHIGHO2_02_FULL_47_11]